MGHQSANQWPRAPISPTFITLLGPPPLSGDNSRQDMLKNVIWTPNAQIREFGPRPPKKEMFENFLTKLESSHLLLSRMPSTTIRRPFQGKICRKRDLCPKRPNMVTRPQTPQKMGLLKMFFKTRKVSPIAFQNVLNHYQATILRQEMSKNVIGAPNAQIKFFFQTRRVSPIDLQNARNHYQAIILRQDTWKNVFRAPNSQIW